MQRQKHLEKIHTSFSVNLVQKKKKKDTKCRQSVTLQSDICHDENMHRVNQGHLSARAAVRKKVHSLLLDRTQDQWFITHGFLYLGCLKTLSLTYLCQSSLSPVTFTNVLQFFLFKSPHFYRAYLPLFDADLVLLKFYSLDLDSMEDKV